MKLEKAEKKKEKIKEMASIDKLKFRFIKQKNKDEMNKNLRHNKILTKHYREQNLQ